MEVHRAENGRINHPIEHFLIKTDEDLSNCYAVLNHLNKYYLAATDQFEKVLSNTGEEYYRVIFYLGDFVFPAHLVTDGELEIQVFTKSEEPRLITRDFYYTISDIREGNTDSLFAKRFKFQCPHLNPALCVTSKTHGDSHKYIGDNDNIFHFCEGMFVVYCRNSELDTYPYRYPL